MYRNNYSSLIIKWLGPRIRIPLDADEGWGWYHLIFVLWRSNTSLAWVQEYFLQPYHRQPLNFLHVPFVYSQWDEFPLKIQNISTNRRSRLIQPHLFYIHISNWNIYRMNRKHISIIRRIFIEMYIRNMLFTKKNYNTTNLLKNIWMKNILYRFLIVCSKSPNSFIYITLGAFASMLRNYFFENFSASCNRLRKNIFFVELIFEETATVCWAYIPAGWFISLSMH